MKPETAWYEGLLAMRNVRQEENAKKAIRRQAF